MTAPVTVRSSIAVSRDAPNPAEVAATFIEGIMGSRPDDDEAARNRGLKAAFAVATPQLRHGLAKLYVDHSHAMLDVAVDGYQRTIGTLAEARSCSSLGNFVDTILSIFRNRWAGLRDGFECEWIGSEEAPVIVHIYGDRQGEDSIATLNLERTSAGEWLVSAFDGSSSAGGNLPELWAGRFDGASE